MTKDDLKNLPTQPGVYLMYDASETVIYVGKSKSLKNRVSSYFSNSGLSPKTAALMQNVAHFEIIITDTEFEALVLECSLIKQYQPKYNILLKDGKAYPFIKITLNQPYPKVLLARETKPDGASYYGPYLSTLNVNEIIMLIKKVWGVRSCDKILPRDIGKSRPCLNYHINQCCAPCDNKISQQDYYSLFSQITGFLNGKTHSVVRELTAAMQKQSDALEFEKAAKTRDQINSILSIRDKQKVISQNRGNTDIIAAAMDETAVCVLVMSIRDGKIFGKEQFFIQDTSLTYQSIVADFIKQYYYLATYVPSQIITQVEVDDADMLERWLSEKCGARIHIVTPQKGEKRQLLDLAMKNAIESLQLRVLRASTKKRKVDGVLFELKNELNLKHTPYRIEAYDISNISGADSVGVCVTFVDGMPRKSSYKKFNIRTGSDTPDDYHAMRETLYRRFTNAQENNAAFLPLPDLIIIDGGKGHVSAALEIMRFFEYDIPLFGAVKDSRHRTRGLVAQDGELSLKRSGRPFDLIARIQDEVHRFALESHKTKHKKSTLQSELLNIKGVGEKKMRILLQHYKNVENIKNAPLQDLQQAGIDRRTAAAIREYFDASM